LLQAFVSPRFDQRLGTSLVIAGVFAFIWKRKYKNAAVVYVPQSTPAGFAPYPQEQQQGEAVPFTGYGVVSMRPLRSGLTTY
jgi:hypothetical protein